MPTALVDETVSYYAKSPSGVTERLPNGNLLVRGLKIFRSGSFRDDRGRPHTYTDEQIAEAAANFTKLKAAGILPNVPVRLDHTSSVRDIVGYFEGVRQDAPWLLADVEFTDEEAAAKYENGTYRNRSCEIGAYRDNDGTRHTHVVQGLAFVDLPAVEGLFTLHREGAPAHEETPVPKFRIHGVETEDAVAVQARLDELEAEVAKPAPLHTFKLAGADTEDYDAVQTYVAQLETEKAAFTLALDEINVAGRGEFVTKLAADNKISVKQVEAMTAHVKDLDADGFASFQKMYEDAPVVPGFAKHGGTGGAPAGEQSDELDAAGVDDEVVANYRRAGMSAEFIAKSAAGVRIAARK